MTFKKKKFPLCKKYVYLIFFIFITKNEIKYIIKEKYMELVEFNENLLY